MTPAEFVAYTAGYGEGLEEGMRRAAKYAARWHSSEAQAIAEVYGRHPIVEALNRAATRCDRIASGLPAFTPCAAPPTT